MPALPSPGKVVRVDLFQTITPNARIRNRLFFSFTGAGPTVGDMNTFLTTCINAWGANMKPLVTSAHALTGIQGTDLTSSTGAQSLLTVSGQVGTSSGTAGAASQSIIIRFKIGRRYRGGHPRFYLGALNNGALTDAEHWGTATGSSVQAGFAAFIAACVTSPPTNLGTMAHVNVSYFAGFTNKTFPSGRTHPVPVVRGTPLVDPVLSYSVNLIVGTQRRRNQQSP